MLQLKGNKTIWVSLGLLGLLILPTFLSLFHPGFFLSDDGNWMVVRLSAFYESIKQGQFPPRFLVRLNHGYGYPVSNFLYPLFLYIGVPIHGIGISFVNTIKIILGLSLLLSGICSFLWLRKFVGHWAAMIGAFVYVVFPYHVFDVYQRGSVGEVLALAILPFILWQIERKKLFFTALGCALLILAHNSLALLFLPIILLYIVYRKAFSLRDSAFIIFYSLALSAFFWIPALYDKQYTIFDKTLVSDISSYFLPFFSPLIGWVTLLVLILTFPFLLQKRVMPFRFFWVLTVISLFFVLSISSPVWKLSHIIPFFQFPYRFLSVTLLGVAALSAMEIELLPRKVKVLGMILLVGIIYLSSWSLLFPTNYQNFPDTFYSTNQDSTTVKNEYMPSWVKNQPTVYTDKKIEIRQGNGVVSNVQFKGSYLAAHVISRTNAVVQINLIYFPGWEVLVDGKRVSVSYANAFGLMQFPLSAGDHTVIARFRETPVRLFADVLSLCSLLVLIVLIMRKQYEK